MTMKATEVTATNRVSMPMVHEERHLEIQKGGKEKKQIKI